VELAATHRPRAVGTTAMTAAQAAAGSDSDAPGRVGRRVIEGVFGRRVRRRERGPLNHAMHWRLLGVAPPVWRQKPGRIAGHVIFHLVYGFAAAAALAVLRRTRD
jgi:hypothetical protein